MGAVSACWRVFCLLFSHSPSSGLLPEEFVRVIRDFLDQTGQKLAVHELWRHASADELDNAYEGLEK